MVGRDNFYKYVKLFGYGQLTGIDLGQLMAEAVALLASENAHLDAAWGDRAFHRARLADALLGEDAPLGTAANPTPLAISWVLEDYLAMLAEAADASQ